MHNLGVEYINGRYLRKDYGKGFELAEKVERFEMMVRFDDHFGDDYAGMDGEEWDEEDWGEDPGRSFSRLNKTKETGDTAAVSPVFFCKQGSLLDNMDDILRPWTAKFSFFLPRMPQRRLRCGISVMMGSCA